MDPGPLWAQLVGKLIAQAVYVLPLFLIHVVMLRKQSRKADAARRSENAWKEKEAAARGTIVAVRQEMEVQARHMATEKEELLAKLRAAEEKVDAFEKADAEREEARAAAVEAAVEAERLAHVRSGSDGYRTVEDRYLCWTAAVKGDLAMLKWARENGCPWDEQTCYYAAWNGHLEVLQWARENGCPWNEQTCYFAAWNGHLEVLQWSRENGCPWNEQTCWRAASNGHLEVLQWARENGCPWNAYKCQQAAIRQGHHSAAEWISNNRL